MNGEWAAGLRKLDDLVSANGPDTPLPLDAEELDLLVLKAAASVTATLTRPANRRRRLSEPVEMELRCSWSHVAPGFARVTFREARYIATADQLPRRSMPAPFVAVTAKGGSPSAIATPGLGHPRIRASWIAEDVLGIALSPWPYPVANHSHRQTIDLYSPSTSGSEKPRVESLPVSLTVSNSPVGCLQIGFVGAEAIIRLGAAATLGAYMHLDAGGCEALFRVPDPAHDESATPVWLAIRQECGTYLSAPQAPTVPITRNLALRCLDSSERYMLKDWRLCCEELIAMHDQHGSA
jgi:hypothetical protein